MLSIGCGLTMRLVCVLLPLSRARTIGALKRIGRSRMDHLTVACYFWEQSCNVDWPAWVQAVGSIGAIVFAGYLARSSEIQAINDNNKILEILLVSFKMNLQ